MMRLSDVGLAHLKSFEGLRLDAYPDPGSKDGLPVTIGYGSTRTMGGAAWLLGDRITEEEATALLRRDAAVAESAVRRLVQVPLTQAQFDALVSFVFNVGEGAFKDSTLLRLLNAGDYKGAAVQFGRWVNNDGKPMDGLVRRRRAEREMFESMPAPAEAATELVAEAPPIAIFDSPHSVPVEAEPMTPVLAALFPALLQQIPELIRSFGDGRVTSRNAAAAQAVVDVVQAATGASNAQAAIEAIAADPVARSAAVSALAADHWLDLTEAGSGGIEGARIANASSAGTPVWQMPAAWVTALLLPLIYMVAGAVIFGSGFSDEMKGIVVGVVLTGALGSIIAYWLGSSIGSKQSGDTVRTIAQAGRR